MTTFCCEAFANEVTSHPHFVAGGMLYPKGWQPEGQIEQDEDGTWSVAGCCGGCYVLSKMRFCPFCGTQLSAKLECEEVPPAGDQT